MSAKRRRVILITEKECKIIKKLESGERVTITEIYWKIKYDWFVIEWLRFDKNYNNRSDDVRLQNILNYNNYFFLRGGNPHGHQVTSGGGGGKRRDSAGLQPTKTSTMTDPAAIERSPGTGASDTPGPSGAQNASSPEPPCKTVPRRWSIST